MNKNVEIKEQVIIGKRSINKGSDNYNEAISALSSLRKYFESDQVQMDNIAKIVIIISNMDIEHNLMFETLRNIKQSFNEFKIDVK